MSQLQQFHAASISAAAVKLRSLRTKLKCEGFPEPHEHGKLMKRIVAVGSQSAGKSALISMLTGVKLESSTSATTRGPTVFRFGKGSGPISAKIWVEIVEDIEGKALPKVVREKETVVAVTDLPEKHREYARLVLNADIDDGELMDDYPLIATDRPIADCSGDKFTRNRIVIELLGEKYPSLEIMDLPGLQAANENKEIQDKIRSITEEELAVARSLALVVCSATSEPVHHGILNHIRRTDAKYERTIIAISRGDELTAQSSPWMDEMKRFPDSHCFVASAVPSGIQEDLATLEKNEARALNASKKAAHHVLRQVPSTALGIANLMRLIIGKFGAEDHRRLTELMQEFKGEINSIDAAADAHGRPDIISKVNLAVDNVSIRLCQALLNFEASSEHRRDRYAIGLRTLLRQQLPVFAHGTQLGGDDYHISTSQLVTEGSFDSIRQSIQKPWSGLVQRHYEELRAHSQASLLQGVEMIQDVPSPAKAKIFEAVQSVLTAAFAETEDDLKKLVRRYSGANQLPGVCSDPAAEVQYRSRFLSPRDLDSLPVTPPTQTRLQLPPTPPSSASSKRPAEDDLESPRRKKKWSGADFIEDLADRTAAHRLRQLDVYVSVCLDRLCQGYADIVSESFIKVAESEIAHEIRTRIGINGLTDIDTVKALMTSVEGVKDAAERRTKLERLITLGDTALSV